MKVKREYLILFVVIAVLVLYIFLRKENRIQYDIPELTGLEREKITAIEIDSKEKNILIRKEGVKWLIGEEKYIASVPAIDDMLDFLIKPVLISVVSDSKSYERYGLDESGRILVKAVSAAGIERSVEIGRSSAGQRHSFIKLENDYRVYNTGKDLSDVFSRDIDDIREKKIAYFDTGEIDAVSLVSGDKRLDAAREEIKVENPSEGTEKESKYIWRITGDDNPDESLIPGIIKEVSTLRCLGFIYDKIKSDFDSPENTVILKGKKEYVLSIFNKDETENEYTVTFSENPSPFKVSMWKVESILDKFKELSGEKEEEKAPEE